MADNNFKGTVEALFTGIDGVVSSKTVVGDAIHIGDTIILPLVDVSFGVGAGAFTQEKKNNGGGGLGGQEGKRSRRCWWQDDTLRSSCDPEWTHKTGKY